MNFPALSRSLALASIKFREVYMKFQRSARLQPLGRRPRAPRTFQSRCTASLVAFYAGVALALRRGGKTNDAVGSGFEKGEKQLRSRNLLRSLSLKQSGAYISASPGEQPYTGASYNKRRREDSREFRPRAYIGAQERKTQEHLVRAMQERKISSISLIV